MDFTTTFTSTFGVAGMTCGHCVRSVKGGLGKLDGVTDVAVDFKTGTVNVTSTTELDRDAIEAAIDEAGYEYVA
jgi:copper ion binding protein